MRDYEGKSDYEEGFQAYLDGIQTNPYSVYTEKGALWQRGWNTAKFGEMLNGSHQASQ